MPKALHSLNSIAARADALRPLLCSCAHVGLDAAWVRVAGELDITSAPELERTLRDSQSQARLVVLDLSELTFVDSAGLLAIEQASIRARKLSRHLLVVRGGSPDVDRVFTLARSSDTAEILELDAEREQEVPADPQISRTLPKIGASSIPTSGNVRALSAVRQLRVSRRHS
jgi:anti-anti-sigma factor